MIRKMAICVVVALVPGFALAAGTNGAASAPATTPAAAQDKSNVTVKTDATAKPDVAKKAVHHRGEHKTGGDKAGAPAVK
jgi:hypothetical protein